MKIRILTFAILATLVVACGGKGSSGPVSSASGVTFKSFDDSLSYALGLQLGENAKHDSFKINLDLYQKGFKDGYDSLNKAFPDSVMKKIYGALQAKLQSRQMAEQAAAEKKLQQKAQELASANTTFLEKNKTKPGVKVTKSGLQYEVIREGKGKAVEENDLLKIKFYASFANGEIFDSLARNKPVDFPSKGLFKGWDEAVKYMKVGGKYRFVFPPQLAFGDKGTGPIPPNSVIIFDVELLDAKPMPMPQGMQIQPAPQGQPQPQPNPR
jgi:FKBP-type peptidyl-prolyl cis-trans isomerase FklB